MVTRRQKPCNVDACYGFTKAIQWECGTFYTFWGRFRVVCTGREVRVEKTRPYPQPDEWAECFPRSKYPWKLLNGERAMASKWIKAAVTKRAKGKPGALPTDEALHTQRPALADFMTDLEGADGGSREPSALMIVCTPDGVRAGLKDEDAGGWCWREGSTLAKALDAIEAALQAGEGAFRGPRPITKKKGK